MAALFDAVLKEGNLYMAWQQVRENKGCAGTDGETLEMFEASLDDKLARLRGEALSRRYRPQPLLRVEVAPEGRKPRTLSIPAVRDRVLQTAVANVLTPILDAEFEDCSFGYRRGRSVQLAVRRVCRLRDEGYRWVVDADIHAFFDEIDHDLLMRELAALVPEKELLDLIQLWLRAEVSDGKTRWRLVRGVPQGSPISPLLSNLYLDHLDEALLAEDLRLVRYADDFLVLCKRRDRAEEALELTEDVLEGLRLRLNRDKTRVVDFDSGFRFLGVQFVRTLAIECKHPEPARGIGPRRDKTAEKPATSRRHPARRRPGRDSAPDADVEPVAGKPLLAKATESSAQTVMAAAFTEAAREVDDQVEATPVSPGPPPESDDADADPRLCTLYLMEQGSVLAREAERFIVRKEDTVLDSVPAIKVDLVMVFGNCQITTQAMNFCLTERIPIALLSQHGNYYGVVDSLDTEPVLLQREQFRRSDDRAFCLRVSKAIITGKLRNSALVLSRYARKRSAPALAEAAQSIADSVRQLDGAESIEQARGYEGAGAKAYYAAWVHTLGAEWGFTGRNRQPPRDPVNALLSYGYTLLFYNIYALIRARGLNPHVGFLHPLRAGHAALVSDLMEEFRSLTVDAPVFNLVLNGRVKPGEFTTTEDGACRMSDEVRRQFIHTFEAKLSSAITYPVTNLPLDYRRCIDRQVQQMAALIRGRNEHYVPMVPR